MNISLCVITKNEEKNISRLIHSCKDSVDEIIVVDSESTDGTVEIAQSFGASVYTRPWTNDFAAAKNVAIDKASGDWIMFLDADEYLQEGCADYVREEIERADRQGFDFLLTRNHDIHEDTGETKGSYYAERIFKRAASIRYYNPIHEYLWNSEGSMRRAYTGRLSFFHTGYGPELIKDKMERNLALLLSDACEESLMRHFYLAEIYMGLGRYEQALSEARGIMAAPGFADCLKDGQKLFRVYVFCMKAMLALGYEQEKVEQTAAEALENFIDHPEIRAVISDLYRHFGQTDKAVENYEAALALCQNPAVSAYDDMFSGKLSERYTHLAALYQELGDPSGECQCLLEALAENKKNEQALLHFFILTKDLVLEDIQELLAGVYDKNSPQELTLLMKLACVAGSNVFFMDALLKLSESGAFRIDSDPGIFARLLFLQGEYDEMIEYAKGKESDTIYERILFEAQLAKACEVMNRQAPQKAQLTGIKPQMTQSQRADTDFWASVTSDLFQAGREDLIRLLLQAQRTGKAEGDGLEKEGDGQPAHINEALGTVFAKYRRMDLYEDLGLYDHKE